MDTYPSDILIVKNLSKAFSGNQALENVNLSILKGEVHALLGENGAGKSTLIKIILGALSKDSGEIIFEGKTKNYRSTREAYADGMAAIFQETSLIPQMTVVENVFLGIEIIQPFGVLDKPKMLDLFFHTCKRLGLNLNPYKKVERMRVTEKRLVEIVKALIKDSRFIVMDEPTDSLPPQEIDHLLSAIEELKNRGITILYITHKLDEVFEVSTRITVLRDGKRVGVLEAKATNLDKIIPLMIGKTPMRSIQTQKGQRQMEEPVLKMADVSLQGTLKNISFEVFSGEVVGVIGLIGSGKTELTQMLFGLSPPSSGNIFLEGRPFSPNSPSNAIEQGVYLVPEDRKAQGLYLDFEIFKNITLTALPKFWGFLGLSNQKEIKATLKILNRIGLKGPGITTQTKNLSGGNQQKLVIGKWLHHLPKVMMLDEPTIGMDVKAKQDITDIVFNLASEGCGILYFSSDFEEVRRISDRILLLHCGRLVKELDPTVSKHEIIHTILTAEPRIY